MNNLHRPFPVGDFRYNWVSNIPKTIFVLGRSLPFSHDWNTLPIGILCQFILTIKQPCGQLPVLVKLGLQACSTTTQLGRPILSENSSSVMEETKIVTELRHTQETDIEEQEMSKYEAMCLRV